MLPFWHVEKIVQTKRFARMIDQDVLDNLEASFKKLRASADCRSLLKKCLTKEVFDLCKTRKTKTGATLFDAIKSGVDFMDTTIGIYAPDGDSYLVFAELFNPVIKEHHRGFGVTDIHPPEDFGDANQLVNLNSSGQFVLSTRISLLRNLKGYAFCPLLTEEDYKNIEKTVNSCLSKLEGEFEGIYHPLNAIRRQNKQMLADNNFLFKEGDRIQNAANANRFWPSGRGVYHNEEANFVVWINKADHVRLISGQNDGDLKVVFKRLVRALKETCNAGLDFQRDSRLGYLTFCPSSLGSAIKSSVYMQLPKLAQEQEVLEELAAKFNMQVKTHKIGSQEEEEEEEIIFSVSHKHSLGITEFQAVMEFQDGILEIIKAEQSAT